jgi:hypothetical protein
MQWILDLGKALPWTIPVVDSAGIGALLILDVVAPFCLTPTHSGVAHMDLARAVALVGTCARMCPERETREREERRELSVFETVR